MIFKVNVFYFDNAATTRVKDGVLKEMIPFFSVEYGNPSSIYGLGREAKRAVELARQRVANLIGANKNEIYFTSGGSESDNLALKGIAFALKGRGNHIITSKIEHPAILESCKYLEKFGFIITYLNVDSEGKIMLDELSQAINDKTILISIMFANNEIGTIQDVRKISKIVHSNNVIFHTDAVQAVGNVEIDVEGLGIDMLSVSSHKIYGPKGVGALYVRKGIDFEKIINGGHQEKDQRAGTENVAGIVGFGKACELARVYLNEHINKIKSLRDYFFTEVKKNIKGIKINGSFHDRLPGNANISFQGINGMDLLLELDNKGICVSSGSACSSGSGEPSRVLTTIGLKNDLAKGTLRVSLGEFNTKEEVDYLVKCLSETVNMLRK